VKKKGLNDHAIDNDNRARDNAMQKAAGTPRTR